MDDRRRNVAAVTIILGVVLLILVILGYLFSKRGIVSPVPEEDAIRILFVSPTPAVVITPTIPVSPTKSKE